MSFFIDWIENNLTWLLSGTFTAIVAALLSLWYQRKKVIKMLFKPDHSEETKELYSKVLGLAKHVKEWYEECETCEEQKRQECKTRFALKEIIPELDRLIKEFENGVSIENIEKTIAKIDRILDRVPPRQEGISYFEIMFCSVMGLIALSLVATLIYMLIKGKEVPDVLQGAVTSIIGFFFGMGTSALSKSAISENKMETKKILEQIEAVGKKIRESETK